MRMDLAPSVDRPRMDIFPQEVLQEQDIGRLLRLLLLPGTRLLLVNSEDSSVKRVCGTDTMAGMHLP